MKDYLLSRLLPCLTVASAVMIGMCRAPQDIIVGWFAFMIYAASLTGLFSIFWLTGIGRK